MNPPILNSALIKSLPGKILILLGIVGWVFSCQMGNTENQAASEIYKLHCKRCHGSDGKKGKKGAKDLNLSTMDLDTRIDHISKGKGKMPAFDERLSIEQVQKVAEYTIATFRQDSAALEP